MGASIGFYIVQANEGEVIIPCCNEQNLERRKRGQNFIVDSKQKGSCATIRNVINEDLTP